MEIGEKRRKALHGEQTEKQRREFLESLPMAGMWFTDLFLFLREQLSEKECDNEMTLTKVWLEVNCPENAEGVMKWLADHGSYCDCEVLMNVEEYFK